VAGTLRRLTLRSEILPKLPHLGACHELGVAIGKMRRLRCLSLRLFQDGRSYQAVGRGTAASGGCPPLFELRLDGVRENADCLVSEPSLIVPSVGNLHIWVGPTGEDALLLCCRLVQVGYKHRFTHSLYTQTHSSCMMAVLEAGEIHAVAW
jgi:hypothetical protein